MVNYKVKKDRLEEVKKAISEFVGAVKNNEPNTVFYASFHYKKDPLSFIHFICFENEEAKHFHESMEYTKKFFQLLKTCCQTENFLTELDLVRSNSIC